jgi:hypothetical protein
LNLAIYGAQGIALGAYRAIKELHPEINIVCFLVTASEKNPSTLSGLAVRELHDFVAGMSQEEKDQIQVLIATPENVMGEIAESLKQAGLHNFQTIDSMRWAKMQEMAFIKSGQYTPLATYPDGVHMPSLTIFQMVHHKDKELKTNNQNPNYLVRLQVGAALANRAVAKLQDDTQDHISTRNGNYSELTGLYWVWKNQIQAGKAENGYVGLAHYRRFLALSEEDFKKMQDYEIDVVLPYPMPYEPNIQEHPKRYLTEAEWSAVLQALQELEPEYAQAFQAILSQEYLYNYNVIVAKSEVLNEYCTWLFGLLFRIEEIHDLDGTKEPNRYLGYVGEILETLYFMYHKKNLKIAYAGCRFLI